MHLILLVAILFYAVNAHYHHRSHRFVNRFETQSVESKFDQILKFDSKTGISYNPYSRQHPGRHVCTAHKNITVPLTTKESFCKPVYKKYLQRCHNDQLCTGVKLTYETSYKNMVTTQIIRQVVYTCCPGWTQISNRSIGCHKPTCNIKCQNGGFCAKPNLCSCSKGFMGRHCELDVNECKENKPCDQICHNTVGSFKCECRETFLLQNDGQSCHKQSGDGFAFEAKDLENDLLDKRLFKLEMLLEKSQTHDKEISKIEQKMENMVEDFDLLKLNFKEVETFRSEVVHLKNIVDHIDKMINKKDKIPKKSPGVLAKYGITEFQSRT